MKQKRNIGKLLLFCILAIAFNLAVAVDEPQGVTDFGKCLTPVNERGRCVILQDCKSLNDLVNSNPTGPDAKFVTASQCGFWSNQVLVCCSTRNLAKKPTGTDSRLKVSDKNLIPAPGVCGAALWEHIVGGTITRIDEFPWTALIEHTRPDNHKAHHCGGSLISARYVITAAHCIKSRTLPSDWKISGVRLGEWDREKNPDCYNDDDCAPAHLDVPVEKTIMHPGYDLSSTNKLNDIALIRLSQNVPFSDFVRPICLPVSTNLRRSSFANVVMDVVGWGKTERSAQSRYKLKANVTVMQLDECRENYHRHGIFLTNAQMCAGGERGVDSCSGDSGGPLIGLEQNFYFLAGIISFGPTECGLEGWPGVYTRVGHYMDWIQNTLEP